jgi:predicted Rossmann fold nucleotide-binding protein DprA/Smf involved in DNA uptake
MQVLDRDSFDSLMRCTSPHSLEHNAQLVNTKRGEAAYAEPRLAQDDTTSPKAVLAALRGYERAYLCNWDDVPEDGLVAMAQQLGQIVVECRVLACRLGIPLEAVQDAIVACELQDVRDPRPAVATAIFGVA